VIALRWRFVFGVWNWIDSIIVILWIVSIFGTSLPVDPNLIRLARLARLVRLLRLAHTIQGFDSLYLISTSLGSSVSILAWTSVLFFIFQMSLALFLTSYLNEYYFSRDDVTEESKLLVYTYFGTFARALFSMFEITLGNWPPMSRMLAENVSEYFMFFGVVHKLTAGFAFVGVVNGVFMQETFKVASTDDRIMVKQKERMVNTHIKKMKMFFNLADSSGDGEIDLDEFRDMVSNPKVAMWLASMELDEKDHDLVFSLIDDGDGKLTLPELIKGVGKLKGAARSIDMVQVMRRLDSMKEAMNDAGIRPKSKQKSVR